jgi:DNA replication protein DnaC
VGKTWLACALGQKACRDGFTAHYARVPRILRRSGDGPSIRKLKATEPATEVATALENRPAKGGKK